MLEKVISGGQTGADQAGLYAARQVGLKTGGMAPKGFKTELGSEYALAHFGLVESESSSYPPRTFYNAANSDATIRIACNLESAGEKLTLQAVTKAKKPHFDIDVYKPPQPKVVAEWLFANRVKVLNVAGNRESTCRNISRFATAYLVDVFNHLKDLTKECKDAV